MCNVFKIAFGKIPNNTVGINKDINKKNNIIKFILKNILNDYIYYLMEVFINKSFKI